jgi:GNAT superfamily N-acetyltransferase
VLADGTMISFRSVGPTDQTRMRDLFYALSQQTLYYRFMSPLKHLSKRELHELTFINHRSDVAIVGTVPEAHGEDIVAIGRYYLNPKTNLAEVAFVVRDGWQNRGIGSFLLKHLATLARRNGIRGFTAEVLRENRAMQRVFQKSEFKIASEPHEGVVSFTMLF